MNGQHSQNASDQWAFKRAIIQRLQALHAAFPHDPAIAQELRKAAARLAIEAAGKKAWELAEEMLSCLEALHATFPQDAEIAHELMETAARLAELLAGERRWREAERMLRCLENLHAALPQDEKIYRTLIGTVRELTSSALHAENLKLAQAMLQRLQALRDERPADAKTDYMLAVVIMQYALAAAVAEEWRQVKIMLQRISELRAARPEDLKTARMVALLTIMIVYHAKRAGQSPIAYQCLVLVEEERSRFPQDEDLLLSMASLMAVEAKIYVSEKKYRKAKPILHEVLKVYQRHLEYALDSDFHRMFLSHWQKLYFKTFHKKGPTDWRGLERLKELWERKPWWITICQNEWPVGTASCSSLLLGDEKKSKDSEEDSRDH